MAVTVVPYGFHRRYDLLINGEHLIKIWGHFYLDFDQ